MTVHSHCVESLALKVSLSDVGEGGVAVNCGKNTIFPEHPIVQPVGNENLVYVKFRRAFLGAHNLSLTLCALKRALVEYMAIFILIARI